MSAPRTASWPAAITRTPTPKTLKPRSVSSRSSKTHKALSDPESRPHTDATGEPEGSTAFSVDLSDLLGKLGYLSDDHALRRKQGSRKLRGEDIARVANHLSVTFSRLSELSAENVKVRADVRFGDDLPGRASAEDLERVTPGNSNRKGAKRPSGRRS
jgi:hypothetical protein